MNPKPRRSSSGSASIDPERDTQNAAPGSQLLELRIRDFAIVDELTLSLDAGLIALTGETGAGKSILIDALSAVLGDRANPAMVRAGAERAIVEATFSRPPVLPPELELDGQDDVIILCREIGAGGRSSARLNGRSVPLSLLQAAGRALVDVHGQTDHQSLMRPSTHLYFLDRFAGLQDQREQLSTLVRRQRQVRQELERLKGDAREMVRQQDLLRFQIEEIDAASLSAGEDEELSSRRGVLVNAEKLRLAAASALGALRDDGQALDAASTATKQVGDAARIDPALLDCAQALESAVVQLLDSSRELTRYLDGIQADPTELQEVEDRLDLIRSLKRKYGETVEDILAFGVNSRKALADLQSSDVRMQQLEAEASALLDRAWTAAEALSAARQAAAEKLAVAVEGELTGLNMTAARFAARVSPRTGPHSGPSPSAEDALQPTGIDSVEFLLAANQGEPPRPLTQVASGGEASRLMLALKSVFSAIDETPVLVFDEIEAGVGARGGHVVGHKLRQLARHHQVLCITHLAPVAALAKQHFKVRKLQAAERTTTIVERLSGDDRVEELAEMLAGRPVTPAARESARALLAGVRNATSAED